MKMNLYKAVIIDAFGKSIRHVVAPSARQAADFVKEYYRSIGEQLTKNSVQRLDEHLNSEDRLGLDDMLRSAPIGFAKQAAIGWIVHATVTQSLRFYRTVDSDGAEAFIVAPNADIGSALYLNSLPVAERTGRRFRIVDGLESLPVDRLEGAKRLLEFGPAGIAQFDPERGWFVR